MEKSMRKIVPALLILLIAAAMIGTSTYAWFSMNNKVTVTGMTVITRVDKNLLIANDTLGSDSRKSDSEFKNALLQQTIPNAVLEPVSTVDGEHFYYTDKFNVQGDGDAMNEVYTAYNPANLTAFQNNYGTNEAKGYVDYVFQLKAVNDAFPSEIRLIKLDMTYGGNPSDLPLGAETAYRVALFYEDITSGTVTSVTDTPANLVAMFRPAAATNFSGEKAIGLVAGAPGEKDVVYCDTYADADTKALIAIPANETHYYKVVVRLWLEGEDKTCRNDTYIRLNDKWSLDLEFQQVSAAEPANAVTVINQKVTAAKPVILTTAGLTTSGSGVITINGVDYYPITGGELYEKQLYTTSEKLNLGSHFFVIPDINHLYMQDVTNQVTLTPTTVDSARDKAALKVSLTGDLLSNGKTKGTYQWKNADGTDAVGVGLSAATAEFTPILEGEYYCLVTSADDYLFKTVSYKVANATYSMATGNIYTTVEGATGYSWKNASDVEVATTRSFTPTAGGTYYCVITDATGTYRTIPVHLIKTTLNANETVGTVELTAGALSNDATPDTYLWKNANGTNAGSTTEEFTATTTGDYYCLIKATDGKTYRTANIRLTGAQINLTHTGDTATITLDGSGNLSNGKTPATYEWKNASDDSDVGTDDPTFTATVSGDYYCVITSSDSKTYTTATVSLTVAP